MRMAIFVDENTGDKLAVPPDKFMIWLSGSNPVRLMNLGVEGVDAVSFNVRGTFEECLAELNGALVGNDASPEGQLESAENVPWILNSIELQAEVKRLKNALVKCANLTLEQQASPSAVDATAKAVSRIVEKAIRSRESGE